MPSAFMPTAMRTCGFSPCSSLKSPGIVAGVRRRGSPAPQTSSTWLTVRTDTVALSIMSVCPFTLQEI